MAGILGRELLAGKDVPQMRAAIGADDFRPAAVGIRDPADRAREFIIEAGPAAAGSEFGRAVKKRILAAAADIDTGKEKIIILAAQRRFRAFLHYDPFLLRRQLIVFGRIFYHKIINNSSIMMPGINPPSTATRERAGDDKMNNRQPS